MVVGSSATSVAVAHCQNVDHRPCGYQATLTTTVSGDAVGKPELGKSETRPVSIEPLESRDLRCATIVLWTPVGAGGHLVGRTSHWWERIHAVLEHRKPQLLVHAALEIRVDHDRYVIEMAPHWSAPRVDRGVVATGPVGLRWLGRSALFRYEVRCWRSGSIPDRRWAVAGPTLFQTKRSQLAAAATCPRCSHPGLGPHRSRHRGHVELELAGVLAVDGQRRARQR